MFKFKLEPYLNYKQSIESIKKTETKLAKIDVWESEEILNNYEKEKIDILIKIRNLQKGVIDPILILFYQKSLENLNKKISIQINKIKELREILNKKLEDLITSQQERKIIEKLKEKEKKSWEKEYARIEQKEFDNLSKIKSYSITRELLGKN